MQDTYYHTCGCPIILEITPARAVFWPAAPGADEESGTIDACPNCGEALLLGDLTPEPIDEWW